MNNHPIEGLMNTAMSNLREMIDVNTIVGDPIETINGTIIIPISKVSFGFAAGGSEFKGETLDQYKKEGIDEDIIYRLPFGGGSGAGVNIVPVGFIIVGGGDQETCPKFIPVDHCNALDKLLDYVPNLLDKIMPQWCVKECECCCDDEECDCQNNEDLNENKKEESSI